MIIKNTILLNPLRTRQLRIILLPSIFLALLLIFQLFASFAQATDLTVSLGVVNSVPGQAIRHNNLSKYALKKNKQKYKSGFQLTKKTKSGKANSFSNKNANLAKSKNAKWSNKKSKFSKTQTLKLEYKPPQDLVHNLSNAVLAPGVIYRCNRGAINLNILDVDLNNPNIQVKPVLAGDTFNKLDEVRDQAGKVNAIAAVNANYFKKDGTPLGTLIIDGEWLAGPLYDRVSLGITHDGATHIDRMNLHGTIETSNPDVACLWVNNINQPRRSGSKLIAYTRRWGSHVKMAYAGCLVAVDSSGRVSAKSLQHMFIPYGGFVLADSKNSPISKLQIGDFVSLQWHPRPKDWGNVVQAVSGGPALIRNGNLHLDLKDENFRKNWTSSSIHARTALGITAEKHLIMVTVEGPHTLWDVAKLLKKLGCINAMNLDGGGSTTMVVHGKIVTRNKNSTQRRVAVSLAILPKSELNSERVYSNFKSSQSAKLFSEFCVMQELDEQYTGLQAVELADPAANNFENIILQSKSQNESAVSQISQEDLEEQNIQSMHKLNGSKKNSLKKKKSLKNNNFGKKLFGRFFNSN